MNRKKSYSLMKKLGLLALLTALLCVLFAGVALAQTADTFEDHVYVEHVAPINETTHLYDRWGYYEGPMGETRPCDFAYLHCTGANDETMADIAWQSRDSADGAVSVAVIPSGGTMRVQLTINRAGGDPAGAGVVATIGGVEYFYDIGSRLALDTATVWPQSAALTVDKTTVEAGETLTFDVGFTGGQPIWGFTYTMLIKNVETDAVFRTLDYAVRHNVQSADVISWPIILAPGAYDVMLEFGQLNNVVLRTGVQRITVTHPEGRSFVDLTDYVDVNNILGNDHIWYATPAACNEDRNAIYLGTFEGGVEAGRLEYTFESDHPEAVSTWVECESDSDAVARVHVLGACDEPVMLTLTSAFEDSEGMLRVAKYYTYMMIEELPEAWILPEAAIIDQTTLTDGAILTPSGQPFSLPDFLPAGGADGAYFPSCAVKLEAWDDMWLRWAETGVSAQSDGGMDGVTHTVYNNDSYAPVRVFRYRIYLGENLAWTSQSFTVHLGATAVGNFDDLFTTERSPDLTGDMYFLTRDSAIECEYMKVIAKEGTGFDWNNAAAMVYAPWNDFDMGLVYPISGVRTIKLTPRHAGNNMEYAISILWNNTVYQKTFTVSVLPMEEPDVPDSLTFTERRDDGGGLDYVIDVGDAIPDLFALFDEYRNGQSFAKSSYAWTLSTSVDNAALSSERGYTFSKEGVYGVQVSAKYQNVIVIGNATVYVGVQPGTFDAFFTLHGSKTGVAYAGENAPVCIDVLPRNSNKQPINFLEVWDDAGAFTDYQVQGFDWSDIYYSSGASASFKVRLEMDTVLHLKVWSNGVSYVKDIPYDIRPAVQPPQISVSGLTDGRLIVTEMSRFAIPSCTITGSDEELLAMLRQNLSLVMLSDNNISGMKNLESVDGASYLARDAGLYSVALRCTAYNATFDYPFLLEVRSSDNEPVAPDLRTWFVIKPNEVSGFFVPEHAADMELASIRLTGLESQAMRDSIVISVDYASSDTSRCALAWVEEDENGWRVMTRPNGSVPAPEAYEDSYFVVNFTWTDDTLGTQSFQYSDSDRLRVGMHPLSWGGVWEPIPDEMIVPDMVYLPADFVPDAEYPLSFGWSDGTEFPDGTTLELVDCGGYDRTESWTWGSFNELLEGGEGKVCWGIDDGSDTLKPNVWYMRFIARFSNLVWTKDFTVYAGVDPNGLVASPYDWYVQELPFYAFGNPLPGYLCGVFGSVSDMPAINRVWMTYVSGPDVTLRVEDNSTLDIQNFHVYAEPDSGGVSVYTLNVSSDDGKTYRENITITALERPLPLAESVKLTASSVVCRAGEAVAVPQVANLMPEDAQLPAVFGEGFYIEGIDDWEGSSNAHDETTSPFDDLSFVLV